MNQVSPISDGVSDAGGAARRILVVDDSRAQRRILSRALEQWGYATVECDSGEAAVGVCRSEDVELVISDWIMPGMSGLDFCKAYRGIPRETPGYFILLTAQNDGASLAEGLESGADDFLSKPFNATELRARLRAGERVLNAQTELLARNRQVSEALEKLNSVYSALDRDLVEARKFQEALVPDRFIDLQSARVSILFKPCGHVGGDLVGMIRVSAYRVGLYLVDVSGHGVASALMTARIAALLGGDTPERNMALEHGADGELKLIAPDEICRLLNRQLLRDKDSDHYLTMIFVDLDLETGKATLAQAGHPSPVVQRGGGGVEFVCNYGMPIGLIEDFEVDSFSLTLGPGDRLLLYSDGITECADPDGTLLEEAGLESILNAHAARRGPDLMAELLAALNARAGGELDDDLSALMVEMKRS